MEMELDGREVREIHCSCGGTYESQEATDMEEKNFGCRRKGCCVRVIQCGKCGTRLVFKLGSPEAFVD